MNSENPSSINYNYFVFCVTFLCIVIKVIAVFNVFDGHCQMFAYLEIIIYFCHGNMLHAISRILSK